MAGGGIIGAPTPNNGCTSAAPKSTTTSTPKPLKQIAISSPPTSSACCCRSSSAKAIVVGDEVGIVRDLNKNGSLASVFETVPSAEEVQHAITVLSQLFSAMKEKKCGNEASSVDKELLENLSISDDFSKKAQLSEKETKHPTQSLTNEAIQTKSPTQDEAIQNGGCNFSQSQGLQILLEAFNLMQSNPSIHAMVTSLSSDKTVWEEIMKNKEIQELKGSFLSGATDGFESSRSITEMKPHNPLYLSGWRETKNFNQESDITSKILWFITGFLKDKLVPVMGTLVQLLSELFGPAQRKTHNQTTEVLDNMLRSSFMLTFLVFLLVIFSRIQASSVSV